MKILKSFKSKIVFVILLAFLFVFIISMMLIVRQNRNFGEISLSKNNNEIFSVNDLTINNIKFGDNYNNVIFELGVPLKEEEEINNSYVYKKLYYDGLVVTLKENYSDYILAKVEITSNSYVSSRNIRVGNNITKLLGSYKIENSNGAYLYGNYTNNAINEPEIKGNINFGYRTSESVTYVNRESIVDGTPTNVAILEVLYEKGKITKISWSYDVK